MQQDQKLQVSQEDCEAFLDGMDELSGGQMKAPGDRRRVGGRLRDIINALILNGAGGGAVIGKLPAILGILFGPDDWPTKLQKIFALFNQGVPVTMSVMEEP